MPNGISGQDVLDSRLGDADVLDSRPGYVGEEEEVECCGAMPMMGL